MCDILLAFYCSLCASEQLYGNQLYNMLVGCFCFVLVLVLVSFVVVVVVVAVVVVLFCFFVFWSFCTIGVEMSILDKA